MKIEDIEAQLTEGMTKNMAPQDLPLHNSNYGFLDPKAPLAHFTDFQTRALLGSEALRTVPVGGLTDEHIAKAVGILEMFDVVLVLEEFEDHFDQLRHVFGWNNFDIPPGTANKHTHANGRE